MEVEALARFPDGRGPDQWFAEALAAGLGTELELLGIEKAIDLLPMLPHDVVLSTSASPTMILDPWFRQTLTVLGPQVPGVVPCRTDNEDRPWYLLGLRGSSVEPQEFGALGAA